MIIYIFFSISECQNYGSLNNYNRKITSTDGFYCDKGIGPGWFRFEGSAGTRMPTSCPPKYRCGTFATSWLNGGHPTVADGQVTRQVCFHDYGSCCQYIHTYIHTYILYWLLPTGLFRVNFILQKLL